jgi:polysaccharide biosynthesis protein PslH
MTTGRGVRSDDDRVLIVSPDAPGPLDRGFRIRVHHLAAELARTYRVTLLAPAAGDAAAATPLRALGVDVVEVPAEARRGAFPRDAGRAWSMLRGGSASWSERRAPNLRRAARELLSARHFSAVQVELPELVDLPVPPGVPVVLDAHNVWSELAARRLARQPPSWQRRLRELDRARYARSERAAWQQATACLVTSDREAAIVRDAGAPEPVVVPNGVDVEAIAPRPHLPGSPARLVFVGLMSYGPNADAVRWAIQELLPRIRRQRPDVVLQVIGGEVTDDVRALAGPGVEISGRLEDVRPALGEASAVVVPLRTGGGTRLKILEALAMAKPVVSTTIGCEGIEVRDGEHLHVRDDADAFAAAVIDVLHDPGTADRLGRCGRELVERRYAWSVVARPLVDLYRRLEQGSRR